MTYARKAFRRLQIGDEGTPGSAVAATEAWSGLLTSAYKDKVIHMPEEDRNTLSKNMANDLIVGRQWDGSIAGDLTTRSAPYLFSSVIRGNITPTQPAATAQPLAYLWTLEPGLTTANTPDITNGVDTFTLEFGDSQQAYEVEFLFTRTLTITITPNGVVTYAWEVSGRQLTETTFTAALSIAAQQRFPSNLVEYYVDSSVANWGNTQKTGELLGATLTFETMFTPSYTTDGTLYFTALNEDKKAFLKAELIFRRGTNSEVQKDAYDSRTTVYHRIAIKGATEIDNGQSNVPYVYIDYAGRYVDWSDVGDDGGSTTETGTLESVYDSTGSKEVSVKILTPLDAYP